MFVILYIRAFLRVFVGRKGKLLHEYNVKNDRTVVAEKEKDMAKEKKLVEAITSMEEDFAQWYTDVVKKAELIDYSAVKGCMIIKPDGYAIWENIQHELDRRFKETGVENVYMPMFIPESLLEKREGSCGRICTGSRMGDLRRTQSATGASVRQTYFLRHCSAIFIKI